MVKLFVWMLIGFGCLSGFLSWGVDASANSLCRPFKGQQVCVETIQRSAKYFWEYRVVISIDGDRQPLKCYDCRQSVGPLEEKATSSTESDLRQLICDFVTH